MGGGRGGGGGGGKREVSLDVPISWMYSSCCALSNFSII